MLGDPCRESIAAARTARADASSLLYGASRTRAKGIGLEYVDFREYSFGDDVRHIDWRLSARMIGPDGEMRLMVKEYEAERRVHAVMAVDLSASMLFASKLWTLLYTASLASYLASKLEDEVSLLVLGGGRIRVFWRAQPSLIPVILYTLVCKKGVGGEARLSQLIAFLRRLGTEPRLMLFTDYDHGPEEAYSLAKALRLLGARSHAILVTDRLEVEPPVENNPLLVLRGVEGGAVAGSLDELYAGIRKHVRSIRAALASGRMGMLEVKGRAEALRSKAKIIEAYLRLRSGLVRVA